LPYEDKENSPYEDGGELTDTVASHTIFFSAHDIIVLCSIVAAAAVAGLSRLQRVM